MYFRCVIYSCIQDSLINKEDRGKWTYDENKKKSKADEATVTVEQAEGLVSYAYKVDGLQDSVISDAIWRLIFQLEGIDKLVLSKDDSVALFSYNFV